MDWIERLTGVELDGGTGTLEWVVLLIPIGIGVLVWRKWKQSSRDRHGPR